MTEQYDFESINVDIQLLENKKVKVFNKSDIKLRIYYQNETGDNKSLLLMPKMRRVYNDEIFNYIQINNEYRIYPGEKINLYKYSITLYPTDDDDKNKEITKHFKNFLTENNYIFKFEEDYEKLKNKRQMKDNLTKIINIKNDFDNVIDWGADSDDEKTGNVWNSTNEKIVHSKPILIDNDKMKKDNNFIENKMLELFKLKNELNQNGYKIRFEIISKDFQFKMNY